MKQLKKYTFLILLSYLIFLTYMLLRPASSLPKDFVLFEGADKIVHCCIFAVLSFLVRMSFPKINFWLFLTILFFYGIITEIVQELSNMVRSGDILDLLADIIGIFIGWFIYIFFNKFILK